MSIDGIALVSGGASGIGQECAFMLAERGAQAVVIADINIDAAQQVVETLKKMAVHPDFKSAAIHFDVADDQSVNDMVSQVVREFECIDYYAHMAGATHPKRSTVAEADMQDYDAFHSTNARGTLLANKAVAAAMLRQDMKTVQGRGGARAIGRGAIVNVASAIAFAGFPGLATATVVAHAVVGITRNAAIDHAAQGVRVNVVCPIWTETPYQETITARHPETQSIIDKMVPIKRMAKAEEVASAVVYLLSSDASYVQGQSIVVDGGAMLA